MGFFAALMEYVHETDVMYTDQDLLNNLHAWLASMSSSSLRPFRHTATTISLAIQSGLVGIAGILDDRIANTEQQLQAAKRSKNKSKSSEYDRSLRQANEHRKICTENIQSFYETIFVHRYRDIDPKIRVECVDALGVWIWNLPKVFMEPNYLRYLGWMLSDANALVRQEVLKQLGKVFKRDAVQLGHFIDRFRARLVEMATIDSELSVRVAAIGVIDTLRANSLMEPTQIDAIGKLIFDNEIRIRRAVVGFFVSCIEDVYDGKVEEMGGSDTLEEFSNVDEDDFESPRQEWVNIKSLAETLAIYDAQIEEARANAAVPSTDVDLLDSTIPETRISLATQVLFERVPEIKNWQILSGYLLFDHTTSAKTKRSKSKSNAAEMAFKNAVAPTPAEDLILLDVLGAAVKTNIAQTAESERTRRKDLRVDGGLTQEEIALQLATIIPQLLNKFGAEPETAAVVLRIEHALNLDAFQQLRQDSGQYEKLLEEISTQFNRHDDKRVLSEAALALLHARQSDELEEIVDGKVAVLWENVINELRNFDKTCELSMRGNLAEDPLKELSTILMKMSKLATISDCVDTLEAEGRDADSDSSIIQILSNIVHRGKYEPLEDEIDDLEDEIVMLAIKTCQFYFMWKVRSISKLLSRGNPVAPAELDSLSLLRQLYRRHVIETLSSRAVVDPTRLFATGSLCDLHLTFATLRSSIDNFVSSAPASSSLNLKGLIQEIEPGIVPELISIFDGTEKQYAKRSKKDKVLNDPAEDEDPLDDEDEDSEDEDADLSPDERYAAELKAEKALCELAAKFVLAITAKILDRSGPQKGRLQRRMLRNQTKLGNNFKEVVAYLEEDKSLRKKKPSGPLKVRALGTNTDAQKDTALNIDIIEEDDIFEEEAEPEEGTAEDLRRRELLDDDPIIDDEEEDDDKGDNEDDDNVLGD